MDRLPQREDAVSASDLQALLDGLRDLRAGEFGVRLARSSHPLMSDIAIALMFISFVRKNGVSVKAVPASFVDSVDDKRNAWIERVAMGNSFTDASFSKTVRASGDGSIWSMFENVKSVLKCVCPDAW